MATQSFYEDLLLDTPEKLRKMEEAFDRADTRGPIDTSGVPEDTDDPEVIRRFIERPSDCRF